MSSLIMHKLSCVSCGEKVPFLLLPRTEHNIDTAGKIYITNLHYLVNLITLFECLSYSRWVFHTESLKQQQNVEKWRQGGIPRNSQWDVKIVFFFKGLTRVSVCDKQRLWFMASCCPVALTLCNQYLCLNNNFVSWQFKKLFLAQISTSLWKFLRKQ